MFKQFYFFAICMMTIWTANYILHQLIWPLLLQAYNYCVHKLPDFQKPWSKSPGVNRETDQNGCLIKCMLKVQFQIKTWWLLTTIDRWPPFRGQSYRIFNREEIKWLHTKGDHFGSFDCISIFINTFVAKLHSFTKMKKVQIILNASGLYISKNRKSIMGIFTLQTVLS